ncbi:alpha/beta-hydrolase, partial [Aureobasidium melanogenum]
MDEMLAKPPSECCFRPGSQQVGTPRGNIRQIGGVDTYISIPPGSVPVNGNVLLYFPDALGLYENAFLMMDNFAAAGYLVLGIDYFAGDSVAKHTTTPLSDPTFDFGAWTQKHLHSSEQIAETWVKSVVEEFGGEGVKFGCVGYCWGARFVCRQLSIQGTCRVGVVAHPSFLKETHVKGVQAPLYIVAPADDELFPHEQRNRTQEILAKGEVHFSMQTYSRVGHGFATRANLEDPYAKWAKEQCFENFVAWLDYWLLKE